MRAAKEFEDPGPPPGVEVPDLALFFHDGRFPFPFPFPFLIDDAGGGEEEGDWSRAGAKPRKLP